MKFGLMFSIASVDSWDAAFENAMQEAVLADKVGFDAAVVGEHHFTEEGYIPSPILACTVMANNTKRIRVGTCVILLPLHSPVEVAEEAAVLDRISGGRFILGVGLGYRPEEFREYNVPLSEAGTRLEEGLKVVDIMLSGTMKPFRGKYYQVSGKSRVTPPPLQKPRPPIWIGAKAERAVRRAARLGDAWIIDPVTPVTIIEERMQAYRDELRKVGKDFHKLERPLRRETYVAETSEKAWSEGGKGILRKWKNYFEWGHVQDERGKPIDPKSHSLEEFTEMVRSRFIVGSPDDMIEEVEKYRKKLDVDEILCQIQFPGLAHDAVMNSIRLIGEKVIPYFRDMER